MPPQNPLHQKWYELLLPPVIVTRTIKLMQQTKTVVVPSHVSEFPVRADVDTFRFPRWKATGLELLCRTTTLMKLCVVHDRGSREEPKCGPKHLEISFN